ncbi:hypothetical protein LSF60_08695 [Rhodococcus pyridinivorans]|uniref:hypothetical protein n=1 Tax=Rhodococcus pyridinivorans TaxID=103816 RepID=UPI001E48B97D|nr:hypothetical protein [Rhodococcus pyridinivorans]UGQ59543.1 hypothetical protein LSF60_08695 [Rhodococcus pyridinivorans]
MNTELWVAVVGGLFSVVVAAVGWVIARQDRSDDRTNISRDLEILNALNPDSPAYAELEKRITKNIAHLVTEQNYKDFARPFYRRYFWFIAVTALLIGTGLLLGEEWDWRETAQVINSLLLLPWIALGVSILWLPIKGLYQLARYIWLKARLWKLERQHRKMSARYEAAQSSMRELLLRAARSGMSESDVLALAREYPRDNEDEIAFVEQLEADIRAVYEQSTDENQDHAGAVNQG